MEGVHRAPDARSGSDPWPSQRDAWRTMRNQNGECGLLGCGEALNGHAVEREGFLYCIGGHAALDSAQRAVDLA